MRGSSRRARVWGVRATRDVSIVTQKYSHPIQNVMHRAVIRGGEEQEEKSLRLQWCFVGGLSWETISMPDEIC